MGVDGYLRNIMPPRAPRADLGYDTDVQRCRRERAKREGRVDPRLEEAAVEFQRHLNRERDKKKGGRPRKGKP